MDALVRSKEKLKNIKSKIALLKLDYNYNNGFYDKKDLERFVNDNKEILEESNNLRKEIKKLKWELMTPEEQAKRIETVRKIMTKANSKSKAEILETIQSIIANEGGL